MTQAITIENMKNMKIRVTVTLVSLILALMAAVAIQPGAQAKVAPGTGESPAAGSLENPIRAKKHMAPLSGKAVKVGSQTETQAQKGTQSRDASASRVSAPGTTNYTGRPGNFTYHPIWGLPYNGGYQQLTTSSATIARSPSYAGNQVITMRTNIDRYEVNNGRLYNRVAWARQLYKVTARPGQVATMPQVWMHNPDVSLNRYFGSIEIWWSTPSGTPIGYQKVDMNGAGDMRCHPSSQVGGGTCIQENPGLYMSFNSVYG